MQFSFLEFFNSSILLGMSLFPILGPHGLPFRRWALVLTRRASFWDSLGPVWQTILRWQACFLFKKTLRQELLFLRPAQDLHTFFDYLFVLILGVLVFAPAAATPPGSSLGKLSGVALLG